MIKKKPKSKISRKEKDRIALVIYKEFVPKNMAANIIYPWKIGFQTCHIKVHGKDILKVIKNAVDKIYYPYFPEL
jgi:hypothetical protein